VGEYIGIHRNFLRNTNTFELLLVLVGGIGVGMWLLVLVVGMCENRIGVGIVGTVAILGTFTTNLNLELHVDCLDSSSEFGC